MPYFTIFDLSLRYNTPNMAKAKNTPTTQNMSDDIIMDTIV